MLVRLPVGEEFFEFLIFFLFSSSLKSIGLEDVVVVVVVVVVVDVVGFMVPPSF